MTTNKPRPPEPSPLIVFGGGILNHNETPAHDTTPPQPVTTLVSTALGPKMPPGSGD